MMPDQTALDEASEQPRFPTLLLATGKVAEEHLLDVLIAAALDVLERERTGPLVEPIQTNAIVDDKEGK